MFWKRKPKHQAPQITDQTFNDIVPKSEIPVLIDFYADWCGPCKMLGPIINELSEEFEGRALVAKVNTETSPALSQHFKVKSIPTMIIFHKGQVAERFSGLIPKPNLEEILEEYIADSNNVSGGTEGDNLDEKTGRYLRSGDIFSCSLLPYWFPSITDH